MKRRLLSLGHSYVVAQNRRLADEMARAGAADWQVTAIAPRFFHGDLRPIALEPIAGEACACVPLTVRASRWPHVFVYQSELRSLLAGGWDLVHCWEEPYVRAAAQVAAWLPPGVPLVVCTAQNLAKRYPPPFSFYERRVLRRAAGWVGFGETVIETLSRRALYARLPHRRLPLGVDAVCFRPDPDAGARLRSELGWAPAGPPVIGYLGRFVPEKGLALLLAALERLTTPWRLLLAGGGPMQARLESWAQRYPGRARIVTGVAHDQVPRYLNAMDLLCAPSQTTPRWREQFGRMLIEAFACGTPVVASRSGEIPYVVGEAGRLLPEDDAAAWAGELSRLLESPPLRRRLALAGRQRVLAEFDWPVVARRYLDFFSELAEGCAAAAPVG